MTERPEGADSARAPGGPAAPDGDDEAAAPGTVGVWFWGTLLVFGAFLVVVPGQDPRARFWLVAGLVLVVASLVGLVTVARGRHRHRTGGGGQ